MTREEALNKTIGILTYNQVNFCKSKEAVANMNEIIEALEKIDQEQCGDCISRQEVLDGIEELKKIHFDRVVVLNKVRDRVLELSPVTQQPKMGRLILLDECSNSGYYCSECHKKVVKEGWSNTVKKIKYCPNCGAKMQEVEE